MSERGIYQGISLPKGLCGMIKEFVKEHPEYNNNAHEFIREAIREKLRREI